MPPLPASRLLVAGRRLLLLPRLIPLVGLNEAIVLQQVRYHLEEDRRPRVAAGRRWVRATVGRWRERDFPFWTTRTIERAFGSLIEQGLVLARQLDLTSGDATNSYTIAWDRLAAIESGAPPGGAWPGGGTGAGSAADESAGPLPALPASPYLDEDDLLPISVRLAELIGLDEAIVLRQVYYWLGDRRRPPVREGRRWVCPGQVPLWESLAFRSAKTIQRVLQNLERRGLLQSSARFNQSPRDRTKWYTIDFAALEALAEAADGGVRAPNSPECRDGVAQDVGIDLPGLSGSTDPMRRAPQAQSVGMEVPKMADTLTGSKTDLENDEDIEQQPSHTHACGEGDAGGFVVVAAVARDDCVNLLTEAGITAVVARRLVARFGPERVRHHWAIHEWERAAPGAGQLLTPGRLRRRIEEDWAPPGGYRSADEKAAVSAERDAAERRRASQDRVLAATAAAAVAERQARLDALGLTGSDQALWARIAQAAPPLPPPFRQALFYAPRGDEPGALIFDRRGDWERAMGPAHRATRAEVASRVAREIGHPDCGVRYLVYDELLGLLRGEPGGADRATSLAGEG